MNQAMDFKAVKGPCRAHGLHLLNEACRPAAPARHELVGHGHESPERRPASFGCADIMTAASAYELRLPAFATLVRHPASLSSAAVHSLIWQRMQASMSGNPLRKHRDPDPVLKQGNPKTIEDLAESEGS